MINGFAQIDRLKKYSVAGASNIWYQKHSN
jgi:hypothetical protein